MTKTETYHLNQWEPDDRILRTDFNADNAAIEAALKDHAAVLAGETATRQAADSVIREEFAAADDTVRTEFAAADTAMKKTVTTETTNRKNEDAAIRKEFAAADAVLRSENMLVKLADITTSAAAAQVNLDVSGIDLTQYAEIILYPRLDLADTSKILYLRANGLTSGYKKFTTAVEYLGAFYPVGPTGGNGAYYGKMYLYPSGNRLVCHSRYNTTDIHIAPATLAISAIKTLNFVSTSSTILAGGKITMYGVKL